jgi:hypothetical protein
MRYEMNREVPWDVMLCLLPRRFDFLAILLWEAQSLHEQETGKMHNRAEASNVCDSIDMVERRTIYNTSFKYS